MYLDIRTSVISWLFFMNSVQSALWYVRYELRRVNAKWVFPLLA